MNLGHFLKCLILALLIGFGTTAKAALAPTYFGWNYIGIAGDSTDLFPEAYLRTVTYEGLSGVQTFNLPDFPLYSPNFGMPDGAGLVNAPTYTTVPGGDGETTRTMGATVPIDWTVTASGIPDIPIREFTFDIPALSLTGITANFGPSHSTWYHLGLIPVGADTELCSNLFAPRGDIYDDRACVPGNPIAPALILSGQLEGGSVEVIFGAATVPVPAAVWLFGTALVGFIGISRRRKLA